MYDLPNLTDVEKVIVDEGVVERGESPKIIRKKIA